MAKTAVFWMLAGPAGHVATVMFCEYQITGGSVVLAGGAFEFEDEVGAVATRGGLVAGG